jgi:hypothetical protein
MRSCTKSPDEEASTIDSKRNLLAYLRSGPQNLTIESYLCLANILGRAGWQFGTERWSKGDQCLPTLDAAIVELEQQVASGRDRLLRRTVKFYSAGNHATSSQQKNRF